MNKIKISDIFQRYKPKYVLGTTFSLSLTFFESIVYPFIDREKLHHCLILCDQLGFKQAVSELSAVSGIGTDYLLSVAPINTSFHPKIWLFIEDKRVGVLAGSGNLTQSGFIENVELFDFFELSEDKEHNTQLVDDVTAFIKGLIGIWDNYNSSSLIVKTVLEKIYKHIATLPFKLLDEESPIRLLSNFDEGLASKLPVAQKLFIAAPFFGGTISGVAELVKHTKASETCILPAIHKDNTVDVPIEKLSKIGIINTLKGDYEKKKGFRHLKMFGGLSDNNRGWTFTGSSNCTKAALLGDNIEVGILRTNYFNEEFFQGENFPTYLPLRRNDLDHNNKQAQWIQIECDNIGKNFNISVSQSCKKFLPIKMVLITIKTGDHRISFQREILFDKTNTESFSWAELNTHEFGENSCHLILNGTSEDVPIEGVAIMNNVHVANMGPQERRAYRTVLSFLSSNELPDYGDLSAVFSLIENVENTKCDNHSSSKENKKEESINSLPECAVLWPPVNTKNKNLLDDHNTVGGFGICQKVLSLLLIDPFKTTDKIFIQGQEDDKGEIRLPDKKVQKRTETLLNQSENGFKALIENYKLLEPSPRNFSLLWGKIIYITLIHLLISKKTSEILAKSVLNSLEDIAFTFIRTMFSWRTSSEIIPISYERYKKPSFPPLATDLKEQYGWEIDKEIGAIVFTFFLLLYHVRRKRLSTFPLIEFLNFKECFPFLQELVREEDSRLKNAFLRYIQSDSDPIRWNDLKDSTPNLLKLNWEDVEGIKVFYNLLQKKNNPQIVYITPGYSCCMQQGCRQAYIQNPELRDLKKYLPVICSGCNSLLVPVLFRGKIDGL